MEPDGSSVVEEIPEAWVGKTVLIGLLIPTIGSAPAAGSFKGGILERVDVFGITGACADLQTDEEPVRAFCPWSAVLQVADVEETEEALGL